MTKRLAVHDVGHDQPTLCLENEETETCTILALFEPEHANYARLLQAYFDTHHTEARAIGEWCST